MSQKIERVCRSGIKNISVLGEMRHSPAARAEHTSPQLEVLTFHPRRAV